MNNLIYYAATEEEIKTKKISFFTRFHVKNLLIHSGNLIIAENGLKFVDWKSILWRDILNSWLENNDLISSKLFATQSRFFLSASAKPIKLLLKNNEIIYFYVNWNFATGLSKNHKIIKIIKEKIQQTV